MLCRTKRMAMQNAMTRPGDSASDEGPRRDRPTIEPPRCSVRCVVESNAARELSKVRINARLTRAEGEVLACALLRMTYREIATVRGVSLNTVKSQMKALLAKLYVDRAEDLVHALSRLPGGPLDCEFTLRLDVGAREHVEAQLQRGE